MTACRGVFILLLFLASWLRAGLAQQPAGGDSKGQKCSTCKGNEVVKCKECEEKRNVVLPENCEISSGSGKTQCQNCAGAGKIKCAHCNGTGKVKLVDYTEKGKEKLEEPLATLMWEAADISDIVWTAPIVIDIERFALKKTFYMELP
jgi:hypothetical protein